MEDLVTPSGMCKDCRYPASQCFHSRGFWFGITSNKAFKACQHCFIIIMLNCFDYDLNKAFLIVEQIPPGFPVDSITTSVTSL